MRRDLVLQPTQVGLPVLKKFGMRQLGATAVDDPLAVLVRRHDTASTLTTTNRLAQYWGFFLGAVPAATAILDRFLAHAAIIRMFGKNHRLRLPNRATPDA